MSLQQLTSVVPPPEAPRCAPTDAEVRSLEKQLGVRFPRDFVRLCQQYGRGTFYSTCTGVSLALPGDYLFDLETSQIRLAPGRKPNCPYRAFPSRPGLLPWAFDEGDSEVYWLVDGASAKDWPIITRLAEQYDPEAFQRFEMSSTEFLAKAFTCQIKVALWDPIRFGHDEREAAELRREAVRFVPR